VLLGCLALNPRPQCIKNLVARHEHGNCASRKQRQSKAAGILIKIDNTPLNRANGKGVNDETGLNPVFDDKQSFESLSHSPKLSKDRAKRKYAPFRIEG
jgi:hypothetical protein